jgi:erythronate-4-phosphate dehydrogenase
VQAFETIGKVKALDTPEITKEAVSDADILIVRSETKVDRALLEGSSVKFVGTVTIGTDHVDEEYLASKGIMFVAAPGSNANSVGEYIVSALLELAHRESFSLDKKTLGIVGIGNVGRNVWRKAEALGMRVILNDPPLERRGENAPLCSLDDLMKADIISIHVPLTRNGPDATYRLFDSRRIGKMKRGSILINTSRGAVVEGDALKQALLDKHLSAAVLDVWQGEPGIDTALLELVSLGTPHIAGYSLDGKVNALQMNYEAACRFLSRPVVRIIKDIIPGPPPPEIKVPSVQTPVEDILREVVKQCYDIEKDDESLRKVVKLPGDARKEYFSKLRAGYRIRREFFNTAVCVPEELKNTGKILKLLGFKIKS